MGGDEQGRARKHFRAHGFNQVPVSRDHVPIITFRSISVPLLPLKAIFYRKWDAPLSDTPCSGICCCIDRYSYLWGGHTHPGIVGRLSHKDSKAPLTNHGAKESTSSLFVLWESLSMTDREEGCFAEEARMAAGRNQVCFSAEAPVGE